MVIHNVDMTYSGLLRLRCDICSGISSEFRRLYEVMCFGCTEGSVRAFEDYCNDNLSQYGNRTQYLIDFLVAPDCGIRLGKRKTKAVYGFFADLACDDNYGYASRPLFLEDIKEIFRDGAENDGIAVY